MLPYLKLLDRVTILEYVNRLISKLDSKVFDKRINIYHIDSLLYSFAFGSSFNIQSLVGEGFVYSKGGRSCHPFRLVGHTPPSKDCMKKIYYVINNLRIIKNYDYKLQISISEKSMSVDNDLYLTNTLNANNISCYFPLKLSTFSCGDYLFYSALCYNFSGTQTYAKTAKLVRLAFLSSDISLKFNRSNYNEFTYIVDNYTNILCKVVDVGFFIEKIYNLIYQYNLSTTTQSGWNNMFALVIDTGKGYYYSTFHYSYGGFTSNSLKHCVDTSLAGIVDISEYTSIAFVFGISDISYNKFQEYGMDLIFSCFV